MLAAVVAAVASALGAAALFWWAGHDPAGIAATYAALPGIDPALIGGLVVRMGGRMVDASLRTKLNAIRLAMREAR